MAEKGFGVKEVNLIGASGTPTITSPNNLNLNAVNVAISTNVSIGGTLTVSGNISIGGTLTYEDVTNIDSVGVVTARNGLNVSGGNVTIAKDIDVDGHTNLDNVSVAGVSTFAGDVVISSATPKISLNDTNNNPDYDILNTDGTFQVNDTTNGAVRFRVKSAGQVDILQNLDVGSNIKLGNAGVVTATSFSGSGANLTSLPAANLTGTLPAISGANLTGIAVTEAPVVDYTVTANGSSAYRFHGGGVDETADDPDLYLVRGQKYRFNNTTGSSHPFAIREASGGSAYSNGVTGSQNGIQFFTVPYDAPAKIFYQCTVHSGMVGNIYIRGANGDNDNVGVTTFSGSVTVGYDTTYSPIQQAANTWYYTRADQASSVSGSNIANLATGSIKISETIPISNMTRQSDAGAHSFYNSSSTSGSVTRDMTAGNPFAPKSYGLTMGTMFYAHTSGNNGSGVIHYGWTPTSHHFFVRYKYNSVSLQIGADTDGSDVWTTIYQNDLMSDSNWYFLVVAVERNGTLLTSLNGAPLTPVRMMGTAPAPSDARFGLAGDGYADNDSRHRYATAFWYRGVMSNELIAQEYAWLKTIWTGASLP